MCAAHVFTYFSTRSPNTHTGGPTGFMLLNNREFFVYRHVILALCNHLLWSRSLWHPVQMVPFSDLSFSLILSHTHTYMTTQLNSQSHSHKLFNIIHLHRYVDVLRAIDETNDCHCSCNLNRNPRIKQTETWNDGKKTTTFIWTNDILNRCFRSWRKE